MVLNAVLGSTPPWQAQADVIEPVFYRTSFKEHTNDDNPMLSLIFVLQSTNSVKYWDSWLEFSQELLILSPPFSLSLRDSLSSPPPYPRLLQPPRRHRLYASIVYASSPLLQLVDVLTLTG
ncbi:hypothetical protein SOVF_062400 [Spinacia oleracea]|nr:hypothetical protein SOVF_062400 [Spinacia oleracea]